MATPFERLRDLTIRRKELCQERMGLFADIDRLRAEQQRLTNQVSHITNNVHAIDDEVKAILLAHFSPKKETQSEEQT